MIEVAPGLFVGNELDYRSLPIGSDNGGWVVNSGWAVLHACKEPFHREFVGYVGRGAPVTSAEYLFARRNWRLALNMIDVADPSFIRDAMVEAAMRFIEDARNAKRKVLIHCNQGGSRGPGLALHWLRHHDLRFADIPDVDQVSFDAGEALMRGLYPLYAPAEGIRGYVRNHWEDSSGEVSHSD